MAPPGGNDVADHFAMESTFMREGGPVIPLTTSALIVDGNQSLAFGFEGLSAEVKTPSKSLHRMLATRGNPSTENFFGIVKALQKKTRTRLRVAVQSS